jgi:hypothetical protein
MELQSYRTDDYSYPLDLFADQRYGGNYVIFFINASVDSKLVREGSNDLFTMNEVDRIRSPYIESQLRRNATVASTTTAAGLTSAFGGQVLNRLGLGGAGTAAGLMGAAGNAVTGATASTATRAQKRLRSAIALHVPNQLQIRYGMQWSEEDTYALEAMQTIGTDAWNALSDLAGSDTSQANPEDQGFWSRAGAIGTSKALQSGPMAGAMSSATGLAANPKKEQVFKGVNFRDFTFDYQFFPRNQAEAQTVQNIIHQFKYHMHPEFKDPNSFLFVYPSEFDISYYQNGEENPNLHKHASCVLTDMNINYTPNGVFSTFDDGSPTQINVTLSFRELALVTKEKIGMTPGEGL